MDKNDRCILYCLNVTFVITIVVFHVVKDGLALEDDNINVGCIWKYICIRAIQKLYYDRFYIYKQNKS